MVGKHDFSQPPQTGTANFNVPIAIGKALLVSAVISGVGNVAWARFYNGPSIISDMLLEIQCGKEGSFQANLPHGIFFEKGIYLAVRADTTHVNFSWYTTEEIHGKVSENGSD